MTDKVKVTFLTEVDERTNIRKLSAEADCSQGEFLLSLVRRYGAQEATRMREAKHGTPAAIASGSGAFAALADDEPILHLFNDYSGGVTTVSRNERGSRLPLASLRLLQENPEFVLNELEVGRLYRVVEGVVGRNSQDSADIVLLEKTEDDWGAFQ